MRNKKITNSLFLIAVIALTLCLCACAVTSSTGKTKKTEETVYALSIHVDESTIPSDAVAGYLSLERISLTVLLSNDETETVPLCEDYIAVSSRTKLNEIGTFSIDVYYMECKTSFQITLHDPAVSSFTLRIRDGLPVSINGEPYTGNKKADEDGNFEDTFGAGDLVTIAWTEEENMSFLYWTRWQGVQNWLPVYWTREDGTKVDNQMTTTVKMVDNFAYMAVDTEIVYTVNFRTFREDLKIGEKTVKKLYASQDDMYDAKDVYSDYLPSITMDNYVFSGWTTTYIESLDRMAGAVSGEYPLIEPSAYEKITEVEDLLSFTLNGKTYYFDSTGSIYKDNKKTGKISDSSINGANKILLSGVQYTYQEGKIYDATYQEVGTVNDLYSFTFNQVTYYFDILDNFYLDAKKEETVRNSTFIYEDGCVYDTSYQYIPVTQNMILYAVWLPIRLSYSPYTSYSEYSAAIDGYQVTEYMGSLTDLEIPDTYNGKKVLSIASSLFENNEKSSLIETVTIPATVLDIGEGTFQYCSSLKAIYVKQGSQVFSGENGVLYRDERSILVAYPANKVMRSYELESNVSNICDYAFYNAVVGKIVMPTVLSSIGSYAFYSDHIDTVDFSKVSVTRLNSAKSRIGTSVFNSQLASIIVSDNVALTQYRELTGFKEFADRLSTDTSAQSLYTYTYSPEVTILFRKTATASAQYFQNKGTTVEIIGITRTVKEIVIPDTLSTGVISYRVSSIGYHAFGGCKQLTDVTLPAYLERVCDKAFDDTPWAQSIGNGLIIGNNILYKYIGGESTVRLPAGVERIAESAFWNNTNLEFINLTDNEELSFISAFAFYGCTALASVSDSQDGAFTLPKTLQTIQSFAFTGTAIRSVVSEEGSVLKEIGESAFKNCHYLKEISFTSATLDTIATDSFFSCECLTNITMTTANSYFATQDGILYKTSFSTASLFLYPAGKLLAVYDTSDYQRRYVDYRDDAFILGGKTFVKEEDIVGGVRCKEQDGTRKIDLFLDSVKNEYYYSIKVSSIGENALYRSNIGGLILGKDIVDSEPIMISGLCFVEFLSETLPVFTFEGLFRYLVYYPDYVYFPEIPKKNTVGFFNDTDLMNEKYCSLLPMRFSVVDGDYVYALQGENVKLVRATRTKTELSVPSCVEIDGKLRLRASVGKYTFDGWYLTQVTFEADQKKEGIGKTVGMIRFSDKTYYFDKNGAVYQTYTAQTLSDSVAGASVNESAGFVRVEDKTYRVKNNILYVESGKRYEEIICPSQSYYRYQDIYYSDTDFTALHEVKLTEAELALSTGTLLILSIGAGTYYVNNNKVYSDRAMTSYVGDYDETAGTVLIDIYEYIVYNNVIYQKTETYLVYQDDMTYQTTYYYNVSGEVFTSADFYPTQKTNGILSATALNLYQYSYDVTASGNVMSSSVKKGDIYGVITLNGVTFYYDYEDNIYLDKERLFLIGSKTASTLTLSSPTYTFEERNGKLWIKNGATYADICYYFDNEKVYGDNSLLCEVLGTVLSGSDISFSATFIISDNTIIHQTVGGEFIGYVTVLGTTYYYDINGKVYEEATFEHEVPSSQINREENKILINDITYYMDNNIVYKEKDMLTEYGSIYGKIVLGTEIYYFGVNGSVYTDNTLSTVQSGYFVDFANKKVTTGETEYLFYEKKLYRIWGDFYGVISLTYNVLFHDQTNVYYDIAKRYKVVGAVRNAESDSIIVQGIGCYMDLSRTIYHETGVGDLEENVFTNVNNIERIIFIEKDTMLIPAITSSTFGSRFNQGLQIDVKQGTAIAFIAKWKSADLQTFTYGTSEASPYLIEGNSPFAVLTYKNDDGEIVMPIDPLYDSIQASDIAEFRLYAKKEGYEVGGWTETVTDMSVIVDDNYVITYNQKLLCTWQARTYTVYIYIDERYTPDFEAEKVSKNKYKVTVEYKGEYDWSLTGYDGNTYLLSGWRYGEKVIQPKGYWSLVLDSETDEEEEVVFYARFVQRVYTLQYQSDVPMINPSQTVYYNTAYTLELPTKEGYTFVGWNYVLNGKTIKLTGADGISLLNWTITEGGENDVYSVVPEWKANTVSVKLFLEQAEGIIYEKVGDVDEDFNTVTVQEDSYYFNEFGTVYSDYARTLVVSGAFYRPSENRFYLGVGNDFYLENDNVYLSCGTASLFEGVFRVLSTDYYLKEDGTVYSDIDLKMPVENAFFDFEDMTITMASKVYYCKTETPYATGEVLFDSSDYSFARVTGIENADYFAGWQDASGVIYTDSDGKAILAWNKSHCALLYAVWPITVSTAGELTAVLMADMSDSIVLTEDITLHNVSFGSLTQPYTGVFNGNNHTIEYFYNDDEGNEWNGFVGLFAVNNGTIKNLTVKVTSIVKDIDTSFYGEEKPVYIGSVCGINNGILSAVKVDTLLMEVTVDGLMMCFEDGSEYFHAGVVCAENNGSVSGQCVYHYSGDTVYYSDRTEVPEAWAQRSDFVDIWKENYTDYYTLEGGLFENVTIPFEQLTVFLSGTETGNVNLSTQRISIGANKYFYENGVVYVATSSGSIDLNAKTITIGGKNYSFENGRVWDNSDLVGTIATAQGTFTIGSNNYMYNAERDVYKRAGTIALRQLTCLIESVAYTLETVYYVPIENVVPYKAVDVTDKISAWDRYYEDYYVLDGDTFVPAGETYDGDTVYYVPKEEEELYEKASDAIDNYLDGYWKDRYERYYTYDGYTFEQVTVPYSPVSRYYIQVKDIFTDKTRFQVGSGTNTMSFTLKEYAER